MKIFELYKYGKNIQIMLKVASYMDGNLAIQMFGLDDGKWEPWNVLTVNLPGSREKDCAFIDTNNNGTEFRFRETILREIDPEGYEQYLSMLEDEEEGKYA